MISSTLKRQVTMPRWRFKASEASLQLVLLLIFLEETPRSASLVGVDDKDSSRVRRTWCEVDDVCVACQPAKNRPACFGEDEPLLGKDLCECCFSCVAARASGESCGAQLSVWFEDAVLGTTISVLATTRCQDGLACARFVCQKLEADASVILGQDAITLSVESVSDNRDASLTRDNDNRNPDGGLYIPETAKAVSRTAVSSRTSSLPPEDAASRNASLKPTSSQPMTENSQPCYAPANEQEFEIDDPLRRVVDVILNEKRFQLVYNSEDDLLAELKILLNAIDERYLESLMDEDGLDSLVNAFAFYSDDGFVNPLTSEVLPELRKLVFINQPRTKRAEDAPKNIGEILIRSASAHREYTEADRFRQVFNTSSVEAPSQGDESTVRVRITTHPRKVDTLIDLGEEEDEEVAEDMKPAQGRRSEDPRSRTEVSRSKEIHRVAPTLEKDAVVATLKTTDNSNAMEIRWNETVSAFGDRLSSLEIRIGVFEKVLEEMAKWCNLGAPATRDCMLPRDANLQLPGQWGFAYSDLEARDRPRVDEDLALASAIDAVRLRDDRRRLLSGNAPLLSKERDSGMGFKETVAARHPAIHRGEDFLDSSQLQLQNHRIVSPSRRLGGFRKWDNRISHPDFLGASTGPRPCYRKLAGRGYSMNNPPWREPIVKTIGEPPIHRMVQRSVVEGRDKGDATKILEKQITKSKIPLPAIVLRGRMKQSNRSYIDQKEARNSDSGSDSAAEKNYNSGVGLTEFQESEVSQRDSGRSRRSLDRDDRGISGLLHLAPGTIRSGSGVPRRDVERATKLFEMQPQPRGEQELVQGSWSLLPKTDADLDALRRRFMSLPLMMRNGERDSHHDDDDEDDKDERTAVQETRMATIFKSNVGAPESEGSTSAEKEDIEERRGPLEESQSAITSYGNSTNRIERISDAQDYGETLPRLSGGGFSVSEEDFDHLYESSESEDEDFGYPERPEYIDDEKNSGIEFEGLEKFEEPQGKVDWPTTVSPRENPGQRISRRTSESAESDAEVEPHIFGPPKRIGRIGCRQKRLRTEPREEKGSGLGANRRSVPAAMFSPARTMESETSNPVSLKISDIERRADGKNGRRLVWR